MTGRIQSVIFYILLISHLYSNNNYPVILIHGFLGWGREEMSNYHYWGGSHDFEAIFRDAGYMVYTVSVGPISPNWERAVETYYQIKGGQLDYGANHSKERGYNPKPEGKSFAGLYPQWDENHPVHIIGHSQGGQTAKMLDYLLKTVFNNEESELLHDSQKGWIKSITTISTPHNGTTLAPIILEMFPFTHNLAPWLGLLEGDKIESLYDFDLDHWGLKKLPDESFNHYIKRVKASPVSNAENLCSWDLSLDGAHAFNQLYNEDSTIYYYSFPASTTEKKSRKNTHKPSTGTSLLLWPAALLIGKYKDAPNETWYENDGIVNTVSMSYPEGASFKYYDGYSQPGIWQVMETIRFDHRKVIGHHVKKKEMAAVLAIYNNHLKLLKNLK